MDKLPEFSFVALSSNDEVVVVKRGVSGYWPYNDGMYKGKDSATTLNVMIDVTPAQAAAMLAGSMFGWNCPGANPDNYDKDGRPL